MGIKYLINIFNGNIITKAKRIQFKLWLEAYNTKYKTNIKHIETTSKVTLDNAWLSGFTDACAEGNGCFICSVLTSKQEKTIVTVRYVISQKDDIDFSKDVALLLKGYITYVKSYNGYNTVVNFSNLNTIIKYIDTYTLMARLLKSLFLTEDD